MLLAETVTFSSAGLNRAAEHRQNLAPLMADPRARCLIYWQGKLLFDDKAGIVRLPLEHRVTETCEKPLIFLGKDADSAPLFAAQLVNWTPEADDPTLGHFFDDSRQKHPLIEAGGFADLRMIMSIMTGQDAEIAATAKAVIAWHETHPFCAKCGSKSDMAMGGWQRDCAACGAHHFPRTDPVVIMLITHGNSVLMGRSPGWPEGMYSLLAGFVEPGETVEAAVRREVFEETGIQVGAVQYLASQPWPFPASLMLGCAGQAVSQEIKIDPSEIEDALWVSREDILDVFCGCHPFIKPARKGAIAHFLLEHWLSDRLD